ncbi:MAG TPA: hypothetical protein VG248_07750 [Caulobacteraceae bacterium]|nr:hypothetical protein [Caulobacteraceae bacterium]
MAAPAPPPPMSPSTEAVGEVRLYHLPGRVDLADGETRQAPFLSAAHVPAHKTLRFRNDGFTSIETPEPAQAIVSFATKGAAGFSDALPAGEMRIFESDVAGHAIFVGERRLAETPKGADLDIDLGQAADVTVKPTLVSAAAIGKRRVRYVMSYEIHNAKTAAASLELRQAGLVGKAIVHAESEPGRSIDASTRGWTVTLPAGADTTLTLDVETMGQP